MGSPVLMYRIFIFVVAASICLSGCGLFGGGNAENTNTNVAVTDDPKDVPKFETLDEALAKGDEYLDANLYRKAIAAFKQAVELDADRGEAHFKLGVAYALQEDLEELPPGVEGNSDKAFRNAVTVYKRYLKENPEDAPAWFNLGRAYGKLFEDKEAADALGKAVKFDEENSQYRTEYGAALNKLARYGEAIKQLEKALELDEDDLRAEDLLEKAQAGKKRVDFKPPDKSDASSNSNANDGETGADSPGANTGAPSRPGTTGRPLPPPPPQQPPANPPASPPGIGGN